MFIKAVKIIKILVLFVVFVALFNFISIQCIIILLILMLNSYILIHIILYLTTFMDYFYYFTGYKLKLGNWK